METTYFKNFVQPTNYYNSEQYYDNVSEELNNEGHDFSLYILSRLQDKYPVLKAYPSRFWNGYLPYEIHLRLTHEAINTDNFHHRLSMFILDYISKEYTYCVNSEKQWFKKIYPVEKSVISDISMTIDELMKDIIEMGIIAGYWRTDND